MEWKLIVFDIDGTLIDMSGAGSRAMNRAFAQLFGWENALKSISFAGRTDLAIVRSVFDTLGKLYSHPEHLHDDVRSLFTCYESILPEEITRTPYKPTPGALELIDTLRTLPRLRIGLATGNLKRAALMKLESAGINLDHSFGAFGNETADRSELVRHAIEQGVHSIDTTEPTKSIKWKAYVIGDTPHDISAAQAAGVHAIAVATGPFSIERLQACNPDLAARDLAEALERRFWTAEFNP